MEQITREEFDRRLDAVNEKRRHQLDAIEAQQEKMDGLLSSYEEELTAVEAELEDGRAGTLAAALRHRLRELAEQTARVAALV